MPPAPTNDGELSHKEKAILALAWKCFETEPKIDWEKLGALGGYTNWRSARNLFAIAKKKLNAHVNADNGADDDGHGNTASPKTPTGKKRKDDAEHGNSDALTPKKAKKTPVKSTPKKGQPTKGKGKGKDKDDDDDKNEIEDSIEVKGPENEEGDV
ncbi:hypothetical protein ONZ43_g4915 [Nemania bipapillata]|uniref:Uncharacterized protein n=1 Tax=Nemania bipapillata TaxID=110536 RepID=A0ACC2IGP8_9PEZI|nr:hypothetical protein ONZ43_g4915 [Nemania bipapillata]